MTAKRLLLVEDDRQLAELVRFHFDRAGYEVTRTGGPMGGRTPGQS